MNPYLAIYQAVPDLSELKTVSSMYALRRAFQNFGSKHVVGHGLVMNFVRLTDTALRRYESGRQLLLEFAEEGTMKFGVAIDATADFESVIDGVHRALGFLKRVRGSIKVERDIKDRLPSSIGLLDGRIESKIVRFRAAIQHLERDIENGTIVQGKAFAPRPEIDGVHLGNMIIGWKDLSAWVREGHACALALCMPSDDEQHRT